MASKWFWRHQKENNVLEVKTLDISFVQKIERENEFLKNENRTLRSELRELRAKFDMLNDALAKKFLGLEMGKRKASSVYTNLVVSFPLLQTGVE